jgi:photosystem II PsbZ protein
MLSILFQLSLVALVLLSFAMVIGVPVAFAVPQYWNGAKRLLWIGSIAWFGLVFLVGGLNFLVV